MYLTISILIFSLFMLAVIIGPFIKKFRESVADDSDGSPFFVYYAIEAYLHSDRRHYGSTSEGDVIFGYIVNLFVGGILSAFLALIWPASLFILISSLILKLILKKMKKSISIIAFAFIAFSCTSVDSGHKGVMVQWGGKTDLTEVYDEGMYTGPSWLWNDMVEYDVRESTLVMDFEFNDKNDMLTKIQVALDWNIDPSKVNVFHKEVKDHMVKIQTALSSAAKEVVPQYGAVDLNKSKRGEGEKKLAEILISELPEFYIQFKRVRFTDIDIPGAVSDLAEQTAVQLGRNELANKKEAEQVALAKALVAKSKGEFEAAEFNVKTKDLMSQPKLLELYRAETDRMWAEKGVSPWGTNNVFGADAATVIKGLK